MDTHSVRLTVPLQGLLRTFISRQVCPAGRTLKKEGHPAKGAPFITYVNSVYFRMVILEETVVPLTLARTK